MAAPGGKHGLGDVWWDIAAVAEALDAPARGEQLVRQLLDRLAEIREKTVCHASQPTIACIEWIDPLMHAENWVPELVDIAGGVVMIVLRRRHSTPISILTH